MAEPEIRHPADGVMVSKGPARKKIDKSAKMKKSTNPSIAREYLSRDVD